MSDPLKTRNSLILRLRNTDDAAAWQEFLEIYHPLIFRLARKCGLQEADALDTTQEVLTRIAKAVNRWEPGEEKGSFRGWLGRITRNLVIDFMRSKKRIPLTGNESSIGRMIESNPVIDETDQVYQLEQQKQIFLWAAESIENTFQPKSWKAFWMTTVEQKTIDDVSKELNMTRGAIYVARSRVMAKLKKQVQRHLNLERSLPLENSHE